MEILYGVWDVISSIFANSGYAYLFRIQKPHYDFGFFLVPLARYQKGI